MPRPIKSRPALRRRIYCATNPEYARELQALNDATQVRKGRFGGLTRALRRNQRVADHKVRLAVEDGWNVPADLEDLVQEVLAKRAAPGERFRSEVEKLGRPMTALEALALCGEHQAHDSQ